MVEKRGPEQDYLWKIREAKIVLKKVFLMLIGREKPFVVKKEIEKEIVQQRVIINSNINNYFNFIFI